MGDNNDNWILIEQDGKLPAFDERVLVYYEIVSRGKKNEDPKVYEHIKIGHLDHLQQGAGYKRFEWRDEEYQMIEPTHWQPLPNKPKK